MITSKDPYKTETLQMPKEPEQTVSISLNRSVQEPASKKRTKTKPETVAIKLSLTRELLQFARQRKSGRRIYMTHVARDAVRSWLDDVEAEAFECELEDGSIFQKGEGDVYPDRYTEQRMGRPGVGQRQRIGATVNTTVYLEISLANRFLNAVFWRFVYQSYVLEDRMRSQLGMSNATYKEV